MEVLNDLDFIVDAAPSSEFKCAGQGKNKRRKEKERKERKKEERENRKKRRRKRRQREKKKKEKQEEKEEKRKKKKKKKTGLPLGIEQKAMHVSSRGPRLWLALRRAMRSAHES